MIGAMFDFEISGALSVRLSGTRAEGAMFERDPKGYYACLGLPFGATARVVRAAFHRCAKQCHPDVDSRPHAKARFQAINEAYRSLSDPGQRATYDNSLTVARPEQFETTNFPFAQWRTELDECAHRKMRLALLLSLGALGCFALLLHLTDTPPPLSFPLDRKSTTLNAHTSPPELAPSSVQVDPVAAAPPPASSSTSVLPRLAPSKAGPLSGAWLVRTPPNSKLPINLLAREEAAEIQRQLINSGYLLGPADGVWNP